jgi:hypothetical protein
LTILSRWWAPAVLAAGLGFGTLMPAPAQARDDELVRVIVDVGDVIFRGGYPYYRYDDRYGYGDRLIVVHDRYRGPVYYRRVPRTVYYRYRGRPPYGNAYGYWREGRWWEDRRWHDRDDDYDRRDRWTRSSWRHDRDDDRHEYGRRHGHGRGWRYED